MNKLFLLALTTMPCLLSAQQNFEIKGKIGHWSAPARIYLMYAVENVKVVDSANMTDGSFSIRGAVPDITLAWLMLDREGLGYNRMNSLTTDYTMLYVYNEKMSVTSKDSIKNISVSGSAINEEGIRYFSFLNKGMKKMNALALELTTIPLERRMDPVFQEEWNKKMEDANTETRQVKEQFIRQNPSSYFSLQSLTDLVNEKHDVAALDSLYNLLSTDLRTGKQGRQLKETIESLRNAQGK